MTNIYETVLHRFSEKIKPTQEIRFYAESDKVAIIVDPRYDALMEAAIRQHMFFLNPDGWNLMVVSHASYADKIRVDFPNCIFAEINESLVYYKDDNPNITIDGYNRMFLSPHFWSAIPAENILVFQKDCFMYRMFDAHFLEYDYVGARSVLFEYENDGQYLIINGGFSLRKKTAMLDCLERASFNDLYNILYNWINTQQIKITKPEKLGKKNEDIFFSLACESLNKKLPKYNTLPMFSVEAEFELSAAGHHGWNKLYHRQGQILEILSNNHNYADLIQNLFPKE